MTVTDHPEEIRQLAAELIVAVPELRRYLVDGELVDDDALDDEEAEREPWCIRSDRAADWALRKLAAATQERERIRQRAEEEIAATKAWEKREARRPERDIAFFEHHLAEWHQLQRPDGARYPLRHGTLTSRKGATVLEVDDDEAFVEAAEGAGRLDWLNIKVTPRKTADVRKAVEEAVAVVTALLRAPWWAAPEELPQVPGARVVTKPRTWGAEVSLEEQPAWLPVPEDESSAA